MKVVPTAVSPVALKDQKVYRLALFVAGLVYFLWWFAVKLILPTAFNPVASRMVVVVFIWSAWGLGFFSSWIKFRLRPLFLISVWFITIHYYYLFYHNGGDINWIVGSFITVAAIGIGLLSNAAMLSYSALVISLSIVLLILEPSLRYSVYFPGILTILLQANLGLRSRLNLLKTLADSNARFQLIFDSAFDGFIVHEKGQIVDVNQSIAEMVGIPREKLIGRDIMEIIHPDARAQAAAGMQREVSAMESIGLRKDGAPIAIEVRAKGFSFLKRSARLVTVQDITDRKRAEKERIDRESMAENLRLRDEFISIASHELKTPISSLKLQAQLLERDLLGGTVSAVNMNKVVSLLNRQLNRLTELVESMLDVSRMSAGSLTVDVQKMDFAEIVREVINRLRQRGGALLIHHESPEHLYMEGDLVRIRQVIENILTNAVKYGQEKPVRVVVWADAQSAHLAIEDHGMGIDAESIRRIFGRFERATSPNISGLGLGLYIAQQIVQAHGGTIEVNSEVGSGSVFTVTFPLSQA